MATARRLAREPMLPSAMRWPRVRMAGPAWHRGLRRAFMSGTGRPGWDHGGAAAARRAAGEPGQCQQVRGLEVIGGESIHRVTAAAFRSRQARDLARRRASGTDGLSRLRGNARAMSTAMGDNQAGGHALLR